MKMDATMLYINSASLAKTSHGREPTRHLSLTTFEFNSAGNTSHYMSMKVMRYSLTL